MDLAIRSLWLGYQLFKTKGRAISLPFKALRWPEKSAQLEMHLYVVSYDGPWWWLFELEIDCSLSAFSYHPLPPPFPFKRENLLRHAVHIASWGFGVHILDSPKSVCKLGIHIMQLHLASGAIIPQGHWLDCTQLWTYVSNVLVFHVNLRANYCW